VEVEVEVVVEEEVDDEVDVEVEVEVVVDEEVDDEVDVELEVEVVVEEEVDDEVDVELEVEVVVEEDVDDEVLVLVDVVVVVGKPPVNVRSFITRPTTRPKAETPVASRTFPVGAQMRTLMLEPRPTRTDLDTRTSTSSPEAPPAFRMVAEPSRRSPAT